MGVVTLEGIVENGQIRLPSDVRLPENTKVYVVVPGLEVEGAARVSSPRLARPGDASDFVLEVTGSDSDAGV